MKLSFDNEGVRVHAPITPAFQQILTKDALFFVAGLARAFELRRSALLEDRKKVQAHIDRGVFPDFLPETRAIRDSAWTISPVPPDLQDRRVEITGPVERKMVINALNSGARTFMADLEDSHAPTWDGTIQGQINLRDAVDHTISHTSDDGKKYHLNEKIATLIVRPRGWHLVEKHVTVDGKAISAGIFDFGLFFYHNALKLMNNGSGPYFYLPKMESYLEARLWNDVFIMAQNDMTIPQGTIKATVLIETILASFQMDEIIYELKEHMAGLNCGRWDYIFSFIKKFKKVPAYIFPDRADITMTSHCMHSYSLLSIKTCHKRGAHAIGGMAAQIPIKDDPEANEKALQKVRDDKTREATDGHDGTWVAHPGLVPLALEVFDRLMPGPNQVDKKREDVNVSQEDLLRCPLGKITEKGLRNNISVGIQYLASWLSGNGCVPINNLMEDAATAEISRAQVWQWLHHPQGKLDDQRSVDRKMFLDLLNDEYEKICSHIGSDAFEKGKFKKALGLFEEIILDENLDDFLTLRAYDYLD
ncbi:MAG: malate synthase A [Proteobacteria bacterium]|nr:malate synthase A [Pseudomonadota bacterium]